MDEDGLWNDYVRNLTFELDFSLVNISDGWREDTLKYKNNMVWKLKLSSYYLRIQISRLKTKHFSTELYSLQGRDDVQLTVKLKIDNCDERFEGKGCNYCINKYYTKTCDVFCEDKAKTTCSDKGLVYI